MKKVVGLLATVVAAAVVVVGGATAKGDPQPLFEDSGFGCGTLDRDGGGLSTTDTYLVWRKNGNVYLRCEAQGTPGRDIVTWTHENTGYSCGMSQFGTTTDWKNVIRRAGKSTLECWGWSDPKGENAPSSSSRAGVG